MTILNKNNQISNWINHNAQMLTNYKSEWIAYNLNGILAHNKNLRAAKEAAEKKGEEYILYFVPDYFGSIYFRQLSFI